MKIGLATNNFYGAFKQYLPEIEIVEKGVHYDLIVFPGGEDISPDMYFMPNTASNWINKKRDVLEMHLLRYYWDFPQTFFFGACRGHQLIQVLMGGRLVQDIQSELGTDSYHEYTHTLTKIVSPESHPLLEYVPEEVNSLHHQGVYLVTTVNRYAPTANIHAMHYKNIVEVAYGDRFFSTQYHPEFMEGQQGFFNALLEFVDRRNKNVAK